MRHLIVALILLLLCSPCFSKMRHLERKEESKRKRIWKTVLNNTKNIGNYWKSLFRITY